MHAGVGSSTVATCGGCLGGAMLSYFCCKSKILQWWSFGKACAVMARRYGVHLQYRLADFIGPYWPLTDIQNWCVLISKLISFLTEFNAEFRCLGWFNGRLLCQCSNDILDDGV